MGGSQVVAEKVADRARQAGRARGAGDAGSRRRRAACAWSPTGARSDARRAIVAVPPKLALAHPLRARTAPAQGRPARGHGPGLAHQGRGDLRQAVLARRRPLRPGRARRRGRQHDLRQQPARRQPRRAVRLPRRRAHGDVGQARRPSQRAQVLENFVAYVGEQAGRPPTTSSRTGRGEVDARLPVAFAAGHPRQVRLLRCGAPSARCTGPGPRRPTTGRATWTAPCAQANAPPGRRPAHCADGSC